MSILSRLLTPSPPPLTDLWAWIAATAREPHWYLRHEVADSVDGRFDMVALVTSLVFLSLEGRGLIGETATLTERFVDDMDGSLREIGIGDMVIGKQMGRVIGALGGRTGAYRAALAADAPTTALAETLARNVWRGAPPDGAAARLAPAVRALQGRIAATPDAALLAGSIA